MILDVTHLPHKSFVLLFIFSQTGKEEQSYTESS